MFGGHHTSKERTECGLGAVFGTHGEGHTFCSVLNIRPDAFTTTCTSKYSPGWWHVGHMWLGVVLHLTGVPPVLQEKLVSTMKMTHHTALKDSPPPSKKKQVLPHCLGRAFWSVLYMETHWHNECFWKLVKQPSATILKTPPPGRRCWSVSHEVSIDIQFCVVMPRYLLSRETLCLPTTQIMPLRTTVEQSFGPMMPAGDSLLT